MSSYQPGIPTGAVALSLDYVNIKNNFGALDTIYGIDHLPYSSNIVDTVGYHKSLHLNPVSTTTTNAPNNVPIVQPPASIGFGQFFSAQLNDGYSADNALFFLSGAGNLSQLTANQRPVVNGFAGHTYLPGPGAFTSGQGSSGTVQIQWGFVDGTHTVSGIGSNLLAGGDNGTVTFVPAFANKLISVWTQLEYNVTTGTPGIRNAGTISVDQNSANFTKTSFTWFAALDDQHYSGFLWIAIGT